MQILPQPLDGILAGERRRKEVKQHSALVALQCRARDAAGVDAVVVEDEMDAPESTVALGDRFNPIDEHLAPFAHAVDPLQRSGAAVQGTGQVQVLVLASRAHLLLHAFQQPVRARLQVEMDVHFALVYSDLIQTEILLHGSNLRDSPLPPALAPGALDEQLSPPPARSHPSEQPGPRRSRCTSSRPAAPVPPDTRTAPLNSSPWSERRSASHQEERLVERAGQA